MQLLINLIYLTYTILIIFFLYHRLYYKQATNLQDIEFTIQQSSESKENVNKLLDNVKVSDALARNMNSSFMIIVHV